MANLLSDILDELSLRARSPHRLRAERWSRVAGGLSLILLVLGFVGAGVFLSRSDGTWAKVGLIGLGLSFLPALLLTLGMVPSIVRDWAEACFVRQAAREAAKNSNRSPS